jgi:hypothetical protein
MESSITSGRVLSGPTTDIIRFVVYVVCLYVCLCDTVCMCSQALFLIRAPPGV